MSASYTALTAKRGDSSESLDDTESGELLKNPSSVRIEPYIPVKKRTLLFDIGILSGIFIVFIICLALILYYGKGKSPQLDESHAQADTRPWKRSYPHLGSESVMRLIDVNGDGSKDAVFGLAQPSDIDNFISQAPYCHQYTKGCLAVVQAADGRTGEQIWNISTYNEIFVLNCGNIDINKDKKMDCLGAGRKGSFIAFDPYTGQLLWNPQNGSESYIEYEWNIYNPLVIDDITGDGVKEVILAHGGDPDFPPMNKSRYPGRLILLDGANGQMIDRFIDMPDGKETYNSPVLFKDREGVPYILIGTGGETIPGSLFIIRVADLTSQIRSTSDRSSIEPIGQLHHVKNGFFELHKSKTKGVMVPVVLADVNNDGFEDIIVSSFDGVIAAYDGVTFHERWQFEDTAAESYTTPGVGYFNDDKHLDFMMHWNYGIWPDYNRSKVVVHSGKDGQALWTFETARFSMTSALVVQTSKPYQDLFVFRVQGVSDSAINSGRGNIHGVDPQRNLTAKPSQLNSDASCNMTNYDNFASHAFIVDWKTRRSPKHVYSHPVDKFYYDAVNESKQISHQHKKSKLWNVFHDGKNTTHCAIMEQSSRTTGAIGDANNDGKLDLVLTYNAQATINDMGGSYIRTESALDVVLIELEKSFKTSVSWKPQADQIWIGYMGRGGVSSYNLQN